MSAKNCLVIAQPRTGSTVLISLIKQLLGQQDAGYELLNYNCGEEWTPTAIGRFDVPEHKKIVHESPEGLIELNRRFQVLKAAGWPTTKVVQQQWRLLGKHQRDEMINGYDSVITLDRRDILEHIASVVFSGMQGHWHRKLGQSEFQFKGGIKIHPASIKKWWREYEEFKWLVHDMPKPANAHFSYEQLEDINRIKHLLSTHAFLPMNEKVGYTLLKGVAKEKRVNHIPNYKNLQIKVADKLKENPDVFLPRTGIEV